MSWAAIATSSRQPHIIIIRITCFFWLVAKAMSFSAWLAHNRTFPVVPAFPALDFVPSAVHAAIFGISAASIALLLIFPKLKWLPAAIIISEICTCLLDVARWQPWEYQYIFIIILNIYHRHRPVHFLTASAFIMASVYIFSGLHKLNGGFLHTIWESMLLRGFFGLSPESIRGLRLHYIGLLLPVWEIVAGVGLLLLKNKRNPAMALIAMHALLLVFLGPWGINYNSIVWPWNVVLIFFLYLLFIRGRTPLRLPLLWRYNKLTVLLWGVLPVLTFVGLWESNFSSGLYSGKTKNLAICFEEAEVPPSLTAYMARDRHNICGGDNMVHVQKWAYNELNLPPYPEAWYYRKLVQKWKAMHPGVPARFYVYCYPYKEAEEIK